jgi:ectoine hydroxylase-related dioxygenase (phytanoyl-CoA dioxygenase family)
VDDVTTENGAISLISGTHKKNSYPEEYIDTKAKHSDAVFLEMKAGDMLIFNSLTWHRGNINKNGQRRRTMFI